MYDDTINVANKIISDADLLDIFQKMDDELKKNIQLCKQETLQNEKYERNYQHWTVKSFAGTFGCTFNFYDSTSVKVDNYNAFITIFNGRLHEVKNMWVRYHYSYWIQDGGEQKYISQSIDMSIYEYKMSINVNLSSEDKKMDDVYQLIKDKILNAPLRYDRVVEKRKSIINKICFARGFVPSIVVCTILAIFPTIRQVYGMSYVLYPILVLAITYLIGNAVFGGTIDSLYSSIVPKQKYVGYDSTNHKSLYKDDIDDYVATSEIIIGKNVDNIKNRKDILEMEEKYGKYIPKELIVLLILSIIMILVGKFI